MEPDITALAASAGTTLVTLLVTDAWQAAGAGFSALWQRVRPERAEAVAGELESARADLLGAQPVGDQETVAEIEAEWQGRIRRLLAGHPEVIGDLRTLLTELGSGSVEAASVTQHATASGHSRVYQAGRDMHLGQR